MARKVLYKGIDISHYQKNIDLNAAKKAGYDFVILKLGENKKDACFDDLYAKAKKAGMKIGAYFFAHASITAAESWNRCKTWLGDKQLDLPLVLDMEAELSSASRKNANTNLYEEFSKMARSAGYGCMIYCNENFINNYIDVNSITDPLWIAKYSSSEPVIRGSRTADIWQYTSGVDTSDFYKSKLDRNKLYITYDELMKKAMNGASTKAPDVASGKPVLKNGSRGTQVKLLQKDLAWLGYIGSNGVALVADGIFGANTAYALKQFQKANKLVVDAEYGPKSEAAMKKLVK